MQCTLVVLIGQVRQGGELGKSIKDRVERKRSCRYVQPRRRKNRGDKKEVRNCGGEDVTSQGNEEKGSIVENTPQAKEARRTMLNPKSVL